MTGGAVTCGWKDRRGRKCGQPAPYVRDCGPSYHPAALRRQPVCEMHRHMLDSINKPQYTDPGPATTPPAEG